MFNFFKKEHPNKHLVNELNRLRYENEFLVESYHFMTSSFFEFRLEADGLVPTKTHSSDAGFDLYCPRDFTYYHFRQNQLKGRHTYVDTGVCINIKKGFVGLVCPRSSMSLRSLPCDLGVVDAGYQGSIKVLLAPPKGMFKEEDVVIKRGDRIAQIVFLPIPNINLSLVAKFSDKSERGDGGLGSSGR